MNPLPTFDIAVSPYQRFLRLETRSMTVGAVEFVVPSREEFLRTDGSDWLHGGVISAAADIAGDYAVATHAGVEVPTIDLRIDFLRPARRGSLVARGTTVRVGRTVGVADVHVFDEAGTLVAVARAIYAMPRP